MSSSIYSQQTSITAKEFMTSRLVTLSPEMDVLDGIRMLLKSRISGAPVVDRDGRFLGVFSEKCSMHVLLDAAYDQLPSNQVRAFMDTDAKTITPDTDLLTVAQVFLLTTYRRLPVLDDNGLLIGQVSRRDVLQAAMNALNHVPARETSLLYLSAIFERHEAPLA